jgi:hypothetical protein
MDPDRQVIGLASRGGTQDPGFLAALLRAGVELTPLLSHPDGLAALALGDASRVLEEMQSAGVIQPPRIQTNDLPWVEFEGARALATTRRMHRDGFTQLLDASQRVASSGGELSIALRGAWRGTDSRRAQFMRSLAMAVPRGSQPSRPPSDTLPRSEKPL